MGSLNVHGCLFTLMAALAAAFALGVVFSTNIVRMAFCLVCALGAVAGVFFLAGAELIGVVQLLVYVGGTMVLLVFGVMLTARRAQTPMAAGGGQWVVAAIVGGAMLAALVQAAASLNQPSDAQATGGPSATATSAQSAASNGGATTLPNRSALPTRAANHGSAAPPPGSASPEQIGLALLGVRADRMGPGEPPKPGDLCGYLLPFELISVHLVVVLIGAAYLARARQRAEASPRVAAARPSDPAGPTVEQPSATAGAEAPRPPGDAPPPTHDRTDEGS